MKRSLTLLLASLMLVFALTACGGNDKQQDNTQNGSAVTGSDNANESQNGGETGGSGSTGDDTNGGSLAEDAGDAVTDGIDDVKDGIDEAGDILTGDNAQSGTTNQTRNTTGGVTYGQMLRNSRVHDRDGDLTDGENSAAGAMF